jgi:hypothetical protein
MTPVATVFALVVLPPLAAVLTILWAIRRG